MAIEALGTVTFWKPTNAATGNTSVSVPADATFMVVMLSSYKDTANNFSGANAVTIGGVSMAIGADGDGSVAAFQGMLWYKVSPATGTQTLAFSFGATPSEDLLFAYRFYKGIDTALPVRSSNAQQIASAGTATTGSLTAVSGDLVIANGWVYLDFFTSWTSGAAEVAHDQYSSSTLSWGEGSPSGNVTVSCTLASDGGVGAIVVKPAATAGQIARPVSDVSVGNWTASSGTDRYAMVDEETASDTDYITSGAAPANDECVLALGALSTPVAGTVTLRVRAKYV